MDYDPHQFLNRYDIDHSFKNALLEILIGPAYKCALQRNEENGVSGLMILDKERQDEKCTREIFDFNADYQEGFICVRSTTYKPVEEPFTVDTVKLIYEDIEALKKNENINLFSHKKIEDRVKFFIRRSLEVSLVDSSVSLRTSMGYQLDDMEVDYAAIYGTNELDEEFEKTCDEQELAGVLRALLDLGLVKNVEVIAFLKQL